jgi:hypothetical protein
MKGRRQKTVHAIRAKLRWSWVKTVWRIAVKVGFLMAVYSFKVERWRPENIINLWVRGLLVPCNGAWGVNLGSKRLTYGSLAAKDTMITILFEMCICRPQTRAMQKVKSKISVEMSSAVIACQRGNLSPLVYPIPYPYIMSAVAFLKL